MMRQHKELRDGKGSAMHTMVNKVHSSDQALIFILFFLESRNMYGGEY